VIFRNSTGKELMLLSGRDATAAMIKRLAHRNANVQLYTLEVGGQIILDCSGLLTMRQLANALSQNCGMKIHKELASRSFTDALLRLTADRVGLML